MEAKITAYHILSVPLMFSFFVVFFSLAHTKFVIYYYFSSSICFLSSLFFVAYLLVIIQLMYVIYVNHGSEICNTNIMGDRFKKVIMTFF